MNRTTLWRLAAVAALLVPLAAVLTQGLVAGGAEKTPAAKALEATPALREQLNTDTFKKLKEKLRKARINGKVYYFAEGVMRLDEDQLRFYARDLDFQFLKYKEAKASGMPSSGPTPGDLMLHVVNGQVMRW